MTTTSTDDEIVAASSEDRHWTELLARLNRQSVDRHFDAYGDVAWDDPDHAIRTDDARWRLGPEHPLGRTRWYQSRPADEQSLIGLYEIAGKMKIGLQFESVLKRGLLVFAGTLPNGAPEFRYVYHEVIEEAQHSLMFQEFVNRTGIDIAGMPPRIELASRMVVSLARRSPARFFLFVLGGEDPIDDFQRDNLRSGDLHPLLERIMRIHVTEEARHLSFARAFLRRQVPALSRRRRFVLSLQTPVTLGAMVQLMLRPSPQLVRRFSIPPEVLREAYGSQARAEQRRSLRKVRKLCVEVGLVNPLSRRLWRAFGIWDEDLPR